MKDCTVRFFVGSIAPGKNAPFVDSYVIITAWFFTATCLQKDTERGIRSTSVALMNFCVSNVQYRQSVTHMAQPYGLERLHFIRYYFL
jgi:hypothetical protein